MKGAVVKQKIAHLHVLVEACEVQIRKHKDDSELLDVLLPAQVQLANAMLRYERAIDNADIEVEGE